MAVKLGSDGDDPFRVDADINITPFIDVILVLLIIFMVAAPLSTADIPVELPTAHAPEPKRPEQPIFVSVRTDLTVAIGERPVPREQLSAALDEATKNRKDERIFLRADKAVSYGDLMDVMNAVRDSGYTKIGLVGRRDEAKTAP